MAEFRISRALVLRYRPCVEGLAWFDALSQNQANGSQDVVFPAGWTAAESITMYRAEPVFHQWFMAHNLLPRDLVAAKFPPIAYRSLFPTYEIT